MPRFPSLRTSSPDDDDPLRRVGRAGLGALMRDRRYFDGNDPEHRDVVDLVRRGFNLVFAERAPDRRDDPFAASFRRLAGGRDDLDSLPEAEREALGRRVILNVLARAGAPLPSGFDDAAGGPRPAFKREDDSTPPLRTKEKQESDTTPRVIPRDVRAEGATSGGAPAQASGVKEARGPGDDDTVVPRQPIGTDGNPIAPDPKDPRYNADGSLKDSFRPDDPWRVWYAENSRFNPKTGEYKFYADLRDFYRDPKTGGWIKVPPKSDNGHRTSDKNDQKGLPPVSQDNPPEFPPSQKGPPAAPVLPPLLRPRSPRPRRR